MPTDAALRALCERIVSGRIYHVTLDPRALARILPLALDVADAARGPARVLCDTLQDPVMGIMLSRVAQRFGLGKDFLRPLVDALARLDAALAKEGGGE